MYIAIEGVKGTGKTTLMDTVGRQLTVPLNAFSITKPIPAIHPYEAQVMKYPQLITNDLFCELLFAARAKWHQYQLEDKNNVIGDRSILTAYVTRWNKWGDPYYTIKRTQKLHKGIKHPDVIVWLQSDVKRCAERVKLRPGKLHGIAEEHPDKIKEAAEIYEELLSGRLYCRKISRVQWLSLPADCPVADLAEELTSIIKYYNN